MAGARAAASLSFTIGVALATLLVAGGIVAGPAILDCAKAPQGFGACLRGKAADHGLRHPTSAPVSVDPGRPAGWIEANATEYDAPAASSTVLLPNKAGRLGADGAAPPTGELTASIDVAPGSGDLRAGGASSAAVPEIALSFSGPDGQLHAGASAPETAAPARVALGQRTGGIVSSGSGQATGLDTPLALRGPGGHLGARASAEIPPSAVEIALGVQTGSIATAGAAPAADIAAPLALQKPGGRLGAGAFAETPPAAVEVALGDAAGRITSRADFGSPAISPPAVLAPKPGDIGTGGAAPAQHPPLIANIAPEAGVLSSGGTTSAASGRGGAVLEPLTPPPPMPEPLPRDWSTLKAAIPTDQVLDQIVVEPVQPLPKPIAPAAKRAPTKQASTAKPHPTAVRHIPKYDPRYPNVIVLPPPNTGENSSFATLEVR